MRAVHTRFSMNIGRVFRRAHKRAIHAHSDWDMADIRQRTDFQRVARRLLYRLVASHGRYSQQVDLWMVGCQQDGNSVVVSWVAVEDDFVLHAFYLFLGDFSDFYMHFLLPDSILLAFNSSGGENHKLPFK